MEALPALTKAEREATRAFYGRLMAELHEEKPDSWNTELVSQVLELVDVFLDGCPETENH